MKIVHVNTFDLRGGAARSAFRIHQGLAHLGHDSTMFVLGSESRNPEVKRFVPPADFLSRIKRRIRRDRIDAAFARYRASRPAGLEPFHDCRSPHGPDILQQVPECDIVHLHWIAGGFVDYWEFFSGISPHAPIVWTLHDMNPFTGGCHYDLGCGRFAGQCGNCPQLGSQEPADLSRRIWEDKRAALAQIAPARLHVVTPSQWLAREVERSSLFQRFPLSVIPYGLDLDTFAPKNRMHARELLGLPVDAKIILFVADGLDNRRKGFPLLIDALAGLHGISGLMLLSVGNGHAEGSLKVPWIHLGSLSQDRMLPAVYSAADIFVIPSLQDNLPNTVLESMASGTPVIGFAVGGIPDMVRPGVSGTLVEPENVTALRVAVEDLLNDPAQLSQMGLNCRRIVEEEYCLELQARRYEALYTGLITQSLLVNGEARARTPREPIARSKDS